MNSPSARPRGTLAYIVGIGGSFLVVALLVSAMRHYNRPPPVDLKRVEDRRKNLSEIHGVAETTLKTIDWQDKAKGFVRLPIQDAMRLTLEEYKNPEAARALRISRAEAANVAPPPPPPSAFE